MCNTCGCLPYGFQLLRDDCPLLSLRSLAPGPRNHHHDSGKKCIDDPRCTEETWVLLPDQTVLALECDNQPKAEKYVIAADKWVPAGSTPVTLVDINSDEIGSALGLPDGRAFCIGATSHTALYTPPAVANQPGTWASGPDFPVLVTGLTTGAKDAPAALLPNGRVLCLVAPYKPSPPSTWGTPVTFFEYDPTANTLAQVPSASNSGGSPFSSRLILLPTGQVLHTNGTSTVAIYTPDGAPDPAWRPTITSVPTALHPGSTYTLKGRQINGLSQAVIYGDEGAMATNYPIVQLTDTATGTVTYCRTHGHSTMGIQTGAVIHSTQFSVPAGAPLGGKQLRVIANGIASAPIAVGVTHKRWKEIKLEIKEHKELIKWEAENLKLVFEDLRKINEGDWRESFDDDAGRQLSDDLAPAAVMRLRQRCDAVVRPPARGGLIHKIVLKDIGLHKVQQHHRHPIIAKNSVEQH